MTLSFSTHWPAKMPVGIAGAPNRFVEKIWKSMPSDIIDRYYDQYTPKLQKLNYPLTADFGNIDPKIHTIRKGGRFKAGDWIHPVIHNRTKKRYQFIPTFACTGTQSFKISYTENKPHVFIDKELISNYDYLEMLALKDGFPDLESFFSWFNEDIDGQIVHWTGFRYW